MAFVKTSYLFSIPSTVEHYASSSTGEKFDGMAFLSALLDFLKIFLGAFALGSAMGMLNALVTPNTIHIKHTQHL